ncbi:MAG TPA: amino acid ABC transporter permease/ATP-binding protein [Acidimicrobiales bacterium]|jgi:polar amino acid transport system permease protein|nr:amino acid ABC transporter permease/ATP-binding protein [Acidimicrobiales bacterium]
MHPFLHYLTFSYLYIGALIALEVSAVSFVGSIVLGVLVAQARASRILPLRWISAAFVWVFRGTPILLQLLILFDGLPSIGVTLSPIWAAVIGFSLNGGAFLGEVIRGGISSTSRPQLAAAQSLGLSPFSTGRLIVMPQALRAILPALGNELITMIKGTSVASIISLNELTQRSEYIASQTYSYFPVLSAAAVIYLLITSAVTTLQHALERRVSLDRPVRRSGTHLRSVPLVGPALGSLDHRLQNRNRHAAVTKSATAAIPSIPGAIGLPSAAGSAARERMDARFVQCIAVRKQFGTQEVLSGVDLTVRRGEVVAIMGPSGAGKSTLLRLINHIDSPDSGVITVDELRVGYSHGGSELLSPRLVAKSRAEARIGMVFQHFNLFDHMTARENVALASIHVYGQSRREAEARADHLLESVGLAAQADRRPHQLSGGQQQRVAIARALAIEPRLMLFDEPTSALDPELVGEVLATMQSLAASGLTMIVVSHEVRFALEAADRVVRMEAGVIVDQGRPSEMLRSPAPA